MMKSKPETVLCLGCAEIFPIFSGEVPTCQRCGLAHEEQAYKRLLEYSKAAVEYGYRYRTTYEDELEEQGELSAYGLAPIADALIWMAAASVSGIIGAASWDLARGAVRRILKQAGKNKRNSFEAEVTGVFENKEEFERFLACIHDFVHVFRTADPRVRSAVITEMVINEKVKLHLEEKFHGKSDEEGAPALERVKNTLQDPPTKEEVGAMWQNLDLSE